MTATVRIINRERGMYAAQCDEGFVIFELLDGDELELGDVVKHPDFSSMGSEDYRNASQGTSLSVYVQNLVGSLDQAKQQCFMR